MFTSFHFYILWNIVLLNIIKAFKKNLFLLYSCSKSIFDGEYHVIGYNGYSTLHFKNALYLVKMNLEIIWLEMGKKYLWRR